MPGWAFSVLVSSGFRAVKTDGGEVVAERGIGAVEPGAGRREFFGQVPAHADGLGALSGKQQCGFAHLSFKFSVFSIQKNPRKGCD